MNWALNDKDTVICKGGLLPGIRLVVHPGELTKKGRTARYHAFAQS